MSLEENIGYRYYYFFPNNIIINHKYHIDHLLYSYYLSGSTSYKLSFSEWIYGFSLHTGTSTLSEQFYVLYLFHLYVTY